MFKKILSVYIFICIISVNPLVIQTLSAQEVDIEAPTKLPYTVFNLFTKSHNSMTFVWDALTDNVGVEGYVINVSKVVGVPAEYDQDVGNVLKTTITGLEPNTSYIVYARAYDAAGNQTYFGSLDH